MNQSNQHINLLWTGGWDSTFQLLQLVLDNKSKVQPYYIIDPKRNSMNNELLAIRTIKENLFIQDPEIKKLILPIIFCMVDDIKIDDDIQNAFIAYKKEKHIGIQYLWLASFCKSNKLSNMQLSVEKSAVPDPNLWDTNLKGKLIKQKNHNQVVSIMNATFIGTKEYEIFQYFSFPLLEVTKQDMWQIAKEKNWLPIINHSWFCGFPTKKNEPCGVCIACNQTLTEGFAYRIPKNRRLYAAYVNNLETPTKSLIKSILQQFGLFKKKDNYLEDYAITPEPKSSSS